jgi:predicted SnoaL-like aldol condensation-catalyzing enzyme
MSQSKEEKNKALVLEAFDTLFNKRDYAAAERYWWPNYGRFSGFGLPVNRIAADILRIENGILVEHWDVIQDEATQEQSKSGNPMFGDKFPKYS